MRKFKILQYKQVGNAVHPLLEFALGKALKRLISKNSYYIYKLSIHIHTIFSFSKNSEVIIF